VGRNPDLRLLEGNAESGHVVKRSSASGKEESVKPGAGQADVDLGYGHSFETRWPMFERLAGMEWKAGRKS
jgi:hypothetical protein